MNKHTPGPWGVESVAPDWDGYDIFATRKEGVPALIASSVGGYANARLMAAAPDMFEAMSEKDGLLIQNALVAACGVVSKAGEQTLATQIWQIMEWQCASLARASKEIAVAQEVEPADAADKTPEDAA